MSFWKTQSRVLRELIHSAGQRVPIEGTSVRQGPGAACRRSRPATESSPNTLLEQVAIYFILGVGYIFFVVPCLIILNVLIGYNSKHLIVDLMPIYLIFVWLPVYIFLPELMVKAFLEGHCKEESDLPLRQHIEQLGTQTIVVREVLLKERNANMFTIVGSALVVLGYLRVFPFPWTVVGSVFVLVPLYYRMSGQLGTQGMLQSHIQVPTASPGAMKPPGYETISSPPQHICVTPPAYEDIRPCDEDIQILLPNSSAVVTGVPLCSVHQSGVRHHDCSQSTTQSQTAPNESASVGSESMDSPNRTDWELLHVPV